VTLVAAYVDAEEAVRQWVNAHPDLKGPGLPLTLGAFLDPAKVRSPQGATWVVLTRIGRRPDDSEARLDPARVSGVLYGSTIEAVALAATAYANALTALIPGTSVGGLRCNGVSVDTGPLRLPADPASRQPRYLVDATFDFAPPA
jgi:hypothetical protein